MFELQKSDNKEENLKLMVKTVEYIIFDEEDIIANLANISAVINVYFDRINWVGFYILRDSELVLGPFQGLPACIRIKLGKGVCGTAAENKKTIIVDDVNSFPGHIACDSASKSEIVIPILKDGELFGVLDLDSPEYNRFGEEEKIYLEKICSLVTGKI